MDEKGILFTILIVLSVIIVGLLVAMVFMSVSYRWKIRDAEENRKGLHDISLTPNQTLKAIANGEFKPGTYEMRSSDGKPLEIMVGGLTRAFNHGDHIVIADGEEITAVSENVVLRKGE
ncbi:MAG: hypothetical protein IKC64_00315 [Clostridia bacterium]|nr:hypothetical protein [Clostridia bacterium]